MPSYQITDTVTPRLKHPFGRLIVGPPERTISILKGEITRKAPPKVIVIGDVVAQNALKNGIPLDLIVIDYKSERRSIEPIFLTGFKIVNVKNPPGSITSTAFKIMMDVCQGSFATAVVVDGEEDLLTLPAIKFAPFRAFVIYGQPHVGIVRVTVTEKIKREVDHLLEGMRKNFEKS